MILRYNAEPDSASWLRSARMSSPFVSIYHCCCWHGSYTNSLMTWDCW